MTLNGKYSRGGMFVYESYAFDSLNNFKYKFSTDDSGSGRYGSGKYRVGNKTLKLKFTDRLKDEREYFEMVPIDTAVIDSNILLFNVTSLRNKGLPFINIVLNDSLGNQVKRLHTNFNGKSVIAIPNTFVKLNLKLSYVGFYKFEKEIVINTSQQIIVKMLDNKGKRILNKKEKNYFEYHSDSITIGEKSFQKSAN